VGKPVIKIAELKAGVIGQTKFTQQTFAPEYHVTSGDMLFSWSGNPDTSIDVFWWRGPDGWLNQHIFKVEPIEGIDKVYFYYLLKYLGPNFAEIARNKQTTGLGHVTIRDLKELTVAVPPLSEQHNIASVLGALDEKIELNRHINSTVEAIGQSIFKSWFMHFNPVRARVEGRKSQGMDTATAALFPSSFQDSDIGEIPAGWQVVTLPEAFEVNPLRSLPQGAAVPYLEMSNMPDASARALAWYDRPFTSGMKFMNGDVLVARITPCLENGKTAFVDFLDRGQVGWGSTEYIVLRSRPPLPLEYAYFLARSEHFRSYAIRSMTGSSGRQRVQIGSLNNYQLVVPSAEVAQAFEAIVAPIMPYIKQSDFESNTLAAIRDTLLPKLITGQVLVKGAEDLGPEAA
jgi:type I restriction enzyme S subunit